MKQLYFVNNNDSLMSIFDLVSLQHFSSALQFDFDQPSFYIGCDLNREELKILKFLKNKGSTEKN